MVYLNAFTASSRTLVREDTSRLSFCEPCCCDGLPDRLCLYVIPTGLNAGGSPDENCQQVDGPNTEDYFIERVQFMTPESRCVNWFTFLLSQSPEPSPQPCWEGDLGSSFGIGVHLYCFQTNQFAIDICWLPTGQPDYPDEPCNPNGFVAGIRPVAENTCDASRGDFWIDFGNHIPFQGAFSCECSFRIYVDECQDGILGEQNPIYYYPAEGIDGIPDLVGMQWYAEEKPGVGSPDHFKKRSTIRINTKCIGVGSRIANRLYKWKIKYKDNQGCKCSELVVRMNAVGPLRIMDEFDYWVEQMRDSAKSWFTVQRGIRGLIKQPLRPLVYNRIPSAIRLACKEELDCLQLQTAGTSRRLARL